MKYYSFPLFSFILDKIWQKAAENIRLVKFPPFFSRLPYFPTTLLLLFPSDTLLFFSVRRITVIPLCSMVITLVFHVFEDSLALTSLFFCFSRCLFLSFFRLYSSHTFLFFSVRKISTILMLFLRGLFLRVALCSLFFCFFSRCFLLSPSSDYVLLTHSSSPQHNSHSFHVVLEECFAACDFVVVILLFLCFSHGVSFSPSSDYGPPVVVRGTRVFAAE